MNAMNLHELEGYKMEMESKLNQALDVINNDDYLSFEKDQAENDAFHYVNELRFINFAISCVTEDRKFRGL